MAVAACPKPETLAAFARGDLTANELACVAEHVGTCEACCRALQLIPPDSFANLARAAAAAPSIGSPGATPAPAANPITQEKVPAGFVNHPRYRILNELGAGGMGTVYKAHDQLMDRVVAVKVVSPHLTAKASALARFWKEVLAAAKLEHVNIVRAYDAGEAGGSQFLVMEFVEGTSLDRLVTKKGPLSVPMACAFTRQAAQGLQHAAEKGMTHRDIKPQNLLVTKKGQVRILDFGLARFVSTEDADENAPTQRLPFGAGKAPVDASVTNPNLLMGTPDYLSPEQAKNSHDVDPRSDIYSLGCTLYFLLTGKPPFAGATTLIDKLVAHTEQAPSPIREERFEVSEGLAAVLAKMMAKNKEDRYQTAKEAADALAPYTRADAGAKEDAAKEPVFEVVDAVVVTPVPPAPVLSTEPVEPLAFDTDPQRGPTLAEVARPKKKKAKRPVSWWKRRKWAVVGAVALFALVAGVLAATSGKKPDGDKQTDPNTSDTAKGNQQKGNGKGGTGTPSGGNPVVTPLKPVLYVLPSDGVYLRDYQPVRDQLEKRGATVKTASARGGPSRTYPQGTQPDSVTVDYELAKVAPGDYSAVVFCGYKWEEYAAPPKGGPPLSAAASAAANLIDQMFKLKRPVCAICVGQGVLLTHDVLRGREAAFCQQLADDRPWRLGPQSGITWNHDKGVVTDTTGGKVVVTAGSYNDAKDFANALFAVLK